MNRTRWINEDALTITGSRARVRREDRQGLASRQQRPDASHPTMNKLEARYAQYLDALKFAGEIREYRFEPFKLKLARKCTYCPDFFVVTKDGAFEVHEVKGFMRDDAAVKLKMAAAAFPWWQFKLIRRINGQWEETTI